MQHSFKYVLKIALTMDNYNYNGNVFIIIIKILCKCVRGLSVLTLYSRNFQKVKNCQKFTAHRHNRNKFLKRAMILI